MDKESLSSISPFRRSRFTAQEMKRFWCCSFPSHQGKLWDSDWPQPSGSSPSVHFGREQIIVTPPAAVDLVHIVPRGILMPLHKCDQLEVGLTCIQSLTCSHVAELSAVSRKENWFHLSWKQSSDEAPAAWGGFKMLSFLPLPSGEVVTEEMSRCSSDPDDGEPLTSSKTHSWFSDSDQRGSEKIFCFKTSSMFDGQTKLISAWLLHH